MFRAMHQSSTWPESPAFNKQTSLFDLSVEPSHFLAWHPKPDELSFKSRISSSSWLQSSQCRPQWQPAHWLDWSGLARYETERLISTMLLQTGWQMFCFSLHATIAHKSSSSQMWHNQTIEYTLVPRVSSAKPLTIAAILPFKSKCQTDCSSFTSCTSQTSRLFPGNPE